MHIEFNLAIFLTVIEFKGHAAVKDPSTERQLQHKRQQTYKSAAIAYQILGFSKNRVLREINYPNLGLTE